MPGGPSKNWGGNISFPQSVYVEPSTIEELQAAVKAAVKVRVVGSSHSFSPLCQTNDTLISLTRLRRLAAVDRSAMTVTVEGGATYADLVRESGDGRRCVCAK